MRLSITLPGFAATLFALLLPAAAAQANPFPITFVATSGFDGNSCAMLNQPCASIAGALARTQAGGTILILDSGLYVGATIDKSIRIVAKQADVFVGGPTAAPMAITVDAGPDDVVYLDGLSPLPLPQAAASGDGVVFLSGKALHLRNCTIQGFTQGAGVLIDPVGSAEVVISDCTITDNLFGVSARSQTGTQVLLDRVTIARNSSQGVRSVQSRTTIRLRGSTVVNNAVGLRTNKNGRIVSAGDNLVADNGSDGAFTHIEALQ